MDKVELRKGGQRHADPLVVGGWMVLVAAVFHRGDGLEGFRAALPEEAGHVLYFGLLARDDGFGEAGHLWARVLL